MANTKLKACLLVNMISPARLRLYSALADHFDLLILHGGTEANRTAWRDVERALPNAKCKARMGLAGFANSEGQRNCSSIAVSFISLRDTPRLYCDSVRT